MSPTSYQLLYPAIFNCSLKSLYIIARGRGNVKSFLQKKRFCCGFQPICRFWLTKADQIVRICKGFYKGTPYMICE